MKLHLGCGKKFLEGYKHIDYSKYNHIDWNQSIYPLPFIEDNSVEEIYSSHSLEYFDFFEVENVLEEWGRCLIPNGKLRLSVPDFNKLLYVYEKTKFNIDRIIGPLFGRWKINENDYIYHKTVFTKQKLEEILINSKYKNIKEWNPLEYFGSEGDSYDDFSKAYFPHMDFKKGIPISLNIIAEKI